jgi:hypothetical protein
VPEVTLCTGVAEIQHRRTVFSDITQRPPAWGVLAALQEHRQDHRAWQRASSSLAPQVPQARSS